MSWGLTAVAASVGGSLISGANSAKASKKAAQAQVTASENASRTARETFDQQQRLAEPFRVADLARQGAYNQHLGVGGDNGSGNYGDLASGFMPTNWMEHMDPGYNFRLSEGLKALDHRLSAAGMNQSGAGMKAAARYGQDYASGEYQNAFNRYQTSRNATLNPLMGNSGATNQLIGAAGNMGGQIQENQIGAGNAQASGWVGGANAWNQAISGATNAMANYGFMNQMFPGGTTPAGATTPGGGWGVSLGNPGQPMSLSANPNAGWGVSIGGRP